MKQINHYTLGSKEVTHRGKILSIPLTGAASDFIASLNNQPMTVGRVPPGYAHRPEMISDLFYDTVTKDWVILMFNNIKDPFQQLNVGDQVLIPKI